jgi:NAD+ synthase (glutamine-hydrolysing)
VTTGPVDEPLSLEAEIYAALTLGVRDYVDKNGFSSVVIALSGGIDSAMAALVAADALGPERVTCVSMPSPYSSEGTRGDARAIAQNLGTEFLELEIESTMKAYEQLLAGPFEGHEEDLTEENVQARIRGNVVMALSNKFGSLVLTTGNKSELSVGYATLYGDMAGGFAVLKDVYKGWVYRLVRWRNDQAESPIVPESVLDRPPSAELREEQLDEDSLPPYEVLDQILEGYIEGDLDAGELVRRGMPAEDVERVIRMVDGAEYKRRQAPPGIRISTRAFGRDRRLPITNRYESRVEPRETSRRLRAL